MSTPSQPVENQEEYIGLSELQKMIPEGTEIFIRLPVSLEPKKTYEEWVKNKLPGRRIVFQH